MVGVLLDSGAIAEPKTSDGSTPLLLAVQFGKIAVVQQLIERKAHVDAADSTGTTPLMIASEGNSSLPNAAPMVEALLSARAKVNVVDSVRANGSLPRGGRGQTGAGAPAAGPWRETESGRQGRIDALD